MWRAPAKREVAAAQRGCGSAWLLGGPFRAARCDLASQGRRWRSRLYCAGPVGCSKPSLCCRQTLECPGRSSVVADGSARAASRQGKPRLHGRSPLPVGGSRTLIPRTTEVRYGPGERAPICFWPLHGGYWLSRCPGCSNGSMGAAGFSHPEKSAIAALSMNARHARKFLPAFRAVVPTMSLPCLFAATAIILAPAAAWDAENLRFANYDAANALRNPPYRAGWTL